MASRVSSNKLSKFYARSEWALAVLAVFTIVSIPLKSLFTETRQLHANLELSKLFDDTAQRGGASYGEMLDQNNNEFVCHLVKASYPHPYCGYSLRFAGNLEAGLNLSKYESLIFDIDYRGEANAIKIYVLNYNPAYSKPDDFRSAQFNIIEFEKDLLAERFEVKLSAFKVADWWRAKYKIPFAYSTPQFSNVPIIQVQTGSKSPAGRHHFIVKGVYAHRQILPNEEFYFGLIILWVTTALAFLGVRLYLQNTVIINQRFKTKVLQKEKEVLDRIAENLDKRSKTDGLTGLLNRWGMEEYIASAFANFSEYDQRFSFIIFDVDHFKKINDHYGHTLGDKILKELAEFISMNIRSNDILGRWGGEEFLLVCPDSDEDAAQKLANKLCHTIGRHTFSADLIVTCSFGVATVVDGDDSSSLFQMADQALYLAKAAGRNQVKLATRD